MNVNSRKIATLLLFLTLHIFASDSTIVIDSSNHFNWKEQIAPALFLTSGLTILAISGAKDSLQNLMPKTENHIEDFIQYVPMVELYSANIFLREHQSTVWDESKLLLISQILNVAIVQSLKRITKEERPNKTNYHSFPSGHTSQAFVGATVLYHEYKESQPILAYSGYLFATATGILRVTNNKHWIPDVLAGAGIGMLVTNLVYYFKPLKKWRPFKKKKESVTITPIFYAYGRGGYNLGMNITF